MRMIAPQLIAPSLVVAEEQEEFAPVSVALVTHPAYAPVACQVRGERVRFNTVVMAFRPTPAELAQLVAGEDLYIGLLTCGRPQQAINVIVGKQDAAIVYGVGVEQPGSSGQPDGAGG